VRAWVALIWFVHDLNAPPQAILAGLLLFVGITCQFWAGLNLNDVPLTSLCNAYSGSPEVMDLDSFNALADWYNGDIQQCEGRRDCYSFTGASRYFMSSSGLDPTRADLMHYADAQFFCKRAPNGVTKNETCYSKALKREELYPCKLWPQQETSPTDSGNWHLAYVPGTRGPIFHVNCYDKTQVYADFLQSIYAGVWSTSDIKAAADQFRQACVVDKGSDGYMLIIGPLIAFMGGVITTCTMFKAFAAPPWPDLGMNMLIISIILLLMGFWSIALATSDEIMDRYTYCGLNRAPLVFQGRWYDNTPCIDLTTDGNPEWHPFVSMILFFDSVYVIGGTMSMIASLMYLGLSSGFTETMMNDRMGKYLVTLKVLVFSPSLPPSPTGLTVFVISSLSPHAQHLTLSFLPPPSSGHPHEGSPSVSAQGTHGGLGWFPRKGQAQARGQGTSRREVIPRLHTWARSCGQAAPEAWRGQKRGGNRGGLSQAAIGWLQARQRE